jgi:hypothetical protein
MLAEPAVEYFLVMVLMLSPAELASIIATNTVACFMQTTRTDAATRHLVQVRIAGRDESFPAIVTV